jgi:plastocyanin
MTKSPHLPTTIVLLGVSAALTLGACSASPQSPSAQSVSSSASSAAPSSSATTSSATSVSTTGTATTPATPPAVAAAAAITIKDFKFIVPASVAPGATVMITNADAQSHTVTSKDGGFDVKVDGGGGVATLTAPKTAGTYTLTCDFHANMTGSLSVK